MLNADTASETIAAAELVAAMMRRPAIDLPATSNELIGRRPGNALIGLAQRTVRKIFKKSELRELWEDGEFEEWELSIQDLQTRLDPDRAYSGPSGEREALPDILRHCFICRQAVTMTTGVKLGWRSSPEYEYDEIACQAHRDCL